MDGFLRFVDIARLYFIYCEGLRFSLYICMAGFIPGFIVCRWLSSFFLCMLNGQFPEIRICCVGLHYSTFYFTMISPQHSIV